MRKKTAVIMLIVFVFVFSLFNFNIEIKSAKDTKTEDTEENEDIGIGNYKDISEYSAEELLKLINEDIEAIYGVSNFYPNTMYGRDIDLKRIDKHIAKGELLATSIVYGNEFKVTQDIAGKEGEDVPYLGYSVYGDSVINDEEFKFFISGWSGKPLSGSEYLRGYNNEDLKEHILSGKCASYTCKQNHSHTSLIITPFMELTTIPLTASGTLEEAIQIGVDKVWAGVTGKEVDYRKPNSNDVLHNAGDKPQKGWIDYLLITIPPTYYSWGEGIRFSKDPSIESYYEIRIPIAPFSMVSDDLDAQFTEFQTSAIEGNDITISVDVTSSFTEEVKPSYSWNIVKADGTPVDDITYRGTGTTQSGNLTLPANRDAVFEASFKMPDETVSVEFEVNGDKEIEEKNYDNNKISETINLLNAESANGDFILPYHALTRDVEYYLGVTPDESKEIFAQLSKPSYASWTGGAEGSLNVTNNSENILKDYIESNNPSVTEAAEKIVRKPQINATINRDSFDDDPLNEDWYSASDGPVTVTDDAVVKAEGSVSRKYKYLYNSSTGREERTRTARAGFNGITDTRNIAVNIYNGQEKLKFEKKFDEKVDFSDMNHDLAWKGTPYTFDVFRFMCHLDTDNKEIDWKQVNGKHQRTFIGQSTGTIKWTVDESMKANYENERANAKNRLKGSSNYPNAVFATDKQLQVFDFPIKSGYYFNPLGTYTCTVETTQFKDSNAPTKEHEELVNQIKASFKFNSTMDYIGNGSIPYRLSNVSEAKDMGLLDIKVTSVTLDDKELKKATEREANENETDELFRQVLEGYTESHTLGSNTDYKYREFIANQKIYEVKETTVITFTLNPKNKVYTHVSMKDGTYKMKVSIDGFAVNSAIENFALDEIKQIETMDEIPITVRGSMYDDQY